MRLKQDHEVALNPLPYSFAACEVKVGCRNRLQPSCLGATKGRESTTPLGRRGAESILLCRDSWPSIGTRRRSVFEINNVQGTSLAVLQ